MATIQIIHEPHDPFLTAKINDKFIVGNEIPDLNYGFYTLTVKSSKLIKITNVLVDGAILANTTSLTHASVNTSTKTRYTIGIVCKFKNKDFLKYVSK